MAEKGFKRKLAAILSADVEGYSRLMDDDEEATVRTLTTYRTAINDLVQQYRGRVVDTPGDNILAEFTSVVDAVNCAVEIQRELAERNAELPYNRKMEFRIGVNLGDVIEEEERIYGDGVNIAARVEALATAGGICLSGRAYDQVENKLGLEYENLGEHQVKNITRPIRVYRVLSFPGAAAHRVVQAKSAMKRKWRNAALIIAAVLVIGGGALAIWNFYFRPPPIEPASVEKMAFPLPDKPSIAVLPFVNLSTDKSNDVIVDGMTEDLIFALARFKELFVIASNSTFTYKGKAVKVQQVAEELGVRYVLEGSMEISKERIRVTAQLIDAIAGHHLWAERYDRPLKYFFQVRDEVTGKLVSSLWGKLDQAEIAAALLKHQDSLDANSLFWRANQIARRVTPRDNAKARELFEKCIELYPDYARCYRMLALTHHLDWQFGWVPGRPQESYQKALKFANKAVAMDPRDSLARARLGTILLYGRKYQEADAQFKEGFKANPNDTFLLLFWSELDVFIGQPEDGVKRVHEAMRLNPFYQNYYLWMLGWAQYNARDYEGAVETLRKMSPMIGVARRILAASLAYLGRMEEARAEAEKFLKENPSFSASYWAATQAYLHEKDRQHAVQGYIMAGLPE